MSLFVFPSIFNPPKAFENTLFNWCASWSLKKSFPAKSALNLITMALVSKELFSS